MGENVSDAVNSGRTVPDFTSRIIAPNEFAASILESVTDAFFALDREWRLTYVNSTAEALLLHAREELLGSVLWDIFPEAVGTVFHRRYNLAVDTGQPQHFEAYYDPLETWFEVRAFPAKDGLAVYFSDVSERKAAEQERDELLARMHAAFEVTDVTLSTLDLDTLLPEILVRLVSLMSADAAAVFLVEQDGSLHVRSTFGLEGTGYERVRRTPGEGFVGAVAEHRMPVYLRDITAEPLQVSKTLVDAGVRTVLGAPLLLGEDLLGIVHVDWRETHEPDETEDAVLRLVADRLALAIRNARLYEQAREAERFSDALNRLNAILHGSLEADEIQRRAVAEVTETMRCDSAAFDVYVDGWWIPAHVHNLPAEMVGQRFSAEEVPYVMSAVESGEPVAVDDAMNDSRSSREVQERYGIPSVLVAPLTRKDRVFGALFFNYHSPHRFTAAEVDFARKFGAAMSLAMENAELYETEHRVARTLQEALLTIPARMDGVEVAHAYRSATARTLVGGDFYDLFESGDNLGVVIGDVSGKGIQAAVLTSLVRHTVRALAEEPGMAPSEIVARANNIFERESDHDTFVTLFLGMLDRSDGTLWYCNAGHSTCAILGADGVVRRLVTNSPLVGAFKDIRFGQDEARLARGDTLFLYTDGLTDARGLEGRFGEERVLESLAAHPGIAAAELVDAVLEDVGRFAAQGLDDDVCIMALRLAEGAPEERG